MIIESKYYSLKNAKEGDIVTITTPPVEMDTKFGKKVKCQIDKGGAVMEFTFNNTALRNVSQGHGSNTDKWVGKQIEIKFDKTKQGMPFLNANAVEELK